MTETSEQDFDWRTDEAVAVREQPAIAIYQNGCGQVVIRRERSWDEEDDCFIPIARENVLTIVAGILRAAEMFDIELIRAVSGGYEDVNLRDLVIGGAVVEPYEKPEPRQARDPRPKDPTAAERQRRRRQKQPDNRDSERDSVTPERDAPLLRAAE